MKKVLSALLMAISIAAVGQTIPTTPNIGLQLIPDGYLSWGPPYRQTMTTIDTWSATVARFPGANGIVFSTGLTTSRVATATDVVGLWSSCSSGYLMFNGTCSTPAGGVTSVFGRTGAVIAAANDYSFSQIGGTISNSQIPATITADTTGNATTATQLLMTPTQCSGGTPVASGIQANGNANCTTGGGSGTGTVTHTAGALTANRLAIGNGAADIKVDPDAGTDGAGNMTAASYSANGTTNGYIGLAATGTAPSAAPTNTIQIQAPNAVTAYGLALPGAQPSATGQYLTCTSANPSVCSWSKIVGTGTQPSVAPGAASGTGGTATRDANAHDTSGTITINLGTALPSGGTVATLTFGTPWSTVPHCVISDGSGDAASNLGVVFNTQSTTTATLTSLGTLVGSTLVYDYICQQ